MLLVFCVGGTAIVAGWRWVDQSITIYRVALNTATEQEVQLFQHGLKDDPDFRQLAFQYQKLFDSCYCAGGPNSKFKLAARRLRVALRRVVEEGLPLMPFGSPLLGQNEDGQELDTYPTAVHTPIDRRDPWEREELITHPDFQRSPLIQRIREERGMPNYFATLRAAADTQAFLAAEALESLRAGQHTGITNQALQVLQDALAGQPTGGQNSQAARVSQALQSLLGLRAGSMASSRTGSMASSAQASPDHERVTATGREDQPLLPTAGSGSIRSEGRQNSVVPAPPGGDQVLRGPGKKEVSAGEAVESRRSESNSFLSRLRGQPAASQSDISATVPPRRSGLNSSPPIGRESVGLEMVTLRQHDPIALASDWVPPPGRSTSEPSEAGRSLAQMTRGSSIQDGSSAANATSQSRRSGAGSLQSEPTRRAQLPRIASASEVVAQLRSSGTGSGGFGQSLGTEASSPRELGATLPSASQSAVIESFRSAATPGRQIRPEAARNLGVKTQMERSLITETPGRVRSAEPKTASLLPGGSRAVSNFAAQRAQAEQDARRRNTAQADAYRAALPGRLVSSDPGQVDPSRSQSRTSSPSRHGSSIQGGTTRPGLSQPDSRSMAHRSQMDRGSERSQTEKSIFGKIQGVGSQLIESLGGGTWEGDCREDESQVGRYQARSESGGGEGQPRVSTRREESQGQGGRTTSGPSTRSKQGGDGREGAATAGTQNSGRQRGHSSIQGPNPHSSQDGSPRSNRGAPSGVVAAPVKLEEEAAQASQ